ncbi:MAG: proline--tRNA ligase [Clostridiales bacterium]|jgi:prolyl-tRNA synthetase|nr:proline--tRNA ligase [Clostridiales bacterium]
MPEKLVEQITARDVDFAKWYTDIVKKADLIDYSSVRGCMILKPYGYALWENIQRELDLRFKAAGHENVYMPLFIPESLLQKEKEHVEGFAPEVAWVTHGGEEKLTERLCVRPTSETLFCELYANIIHSYRDLPKLYNQWCSVVRWEKTTRPFLRSLEFLWQEGHTAHVDEAEARGETLKMLDVYADFCREFLAIPVVKGRKTDKEKFAGARETYTIEAIMHDGKALQAGTTHYFGDGFARAFGIQFSDKDNKLQYVHQTSWGMSTRIIGAVIMVHSDDNGLSLPPKLAPVQVVIVPIAPHKSRVLEKAREVLEDVSAVARVKLDDSDKQSGWKFSEHEMRGVPVRLEIGPKDIEQGQATLVRRDTREKTAVPLKELSMKIPKLLKEIQAGMYERAKKRLEDGTHTAQNFDEFKDIIEREGGFIKAMWCGAQECEEIIKAETGATSRCMPHGQEAVGDECVCCGRPAKTLVYWGKAY